MSAKLSITSWWILALMSLFLWYRNIRYDRALSIFVFSLGLLQLVQYGVFSGADSQQSGRALYIILWLQCLVLSIGVFLFIKTNRDLDNPSINENIVYTISEWVIIFYSMIFFIALALSFISSWTFETIVTNDNKDITVVIHGRDSSSCVLGYWNILYIFGILIPLILISAYYRFSEIGSVILILYIIIGIIALGKDYLFSENFSYYTVGFAFMSWIVGMINYV